MLLSRSSQWLLHNFDHLSFSKLWKLIECVSVCCCKFFQHQNWMDINLNDSFLMQLAKTSVRFDYQNFWNQLNVYLAVFEFLNIKTEWKNHCWFCDGTATVSVQYHSSFVPRISKTNWMLISLLFLFLLHQNLMENENSRMFFVMEPFFSDSFNLFSVSSISCSKLSKSIDKYIYIYKYGWWQWLMAVASFLF